MSNINDIQATLSDKLISKYGDIEAIKYLAIVPNNNPSKYDFKIGFVRNEIEKNKIKEIKGYLQNIIMEIYGINLSVEDYKKSKRMKKTISKVKSSKEKSHFEFYEQKSKIPIGQTAIRLEGDGGSKGTLGAIINFEGISDAFLISNYHVILKNCNNIGRSVYKVSRNKIKKIGEVCWGISNDQFDVAIAKLDDTTTTGTNPYGYVLGDIVDISNNTPDVCFIGQKSRYEEGKIFSFNATVKVSNKWYKNQLLCNDITSCKGDSGSILSLRDEINRKRDVIGLVMGGDCNKKTVANNLYLLLKSNRQIVPCKKDGLPDTLKFNSFIN
ncbi:hypothetical protein [uncultured Dokdonia sp.]|uniref:hypothetical protein n=1 Tax=uncultured Dokdonia sp. TaxID=575653 RepID=UPI0026349569|nr:hypothetical protein [uncultured Dokdonia sp.]